MSEIGELFLLECKKSFRGLKSNAEKAMEQISEADLHFFPEKESNNLTILIKHLSGNMLSRFTDFLTTDGEKPDRNRDDEFVDKGETKDELFNKWNKGWNCVFQALEELKPDNLTNIVKIRNEDHTVIRALNRQLAHYAYHTGQIVYICKLIQSSEFKSLSIPRNPNKSLFDSRKEN
jgi:hypothetical protein